MSRTALAGIDPRSIMQVFAQYGFRKSSMEDIARAVGLSRQSIYKKFGSKEACYEQVLQDYLADLYARAFAVLESEDGSALVLLEQVFDIIGGDGVEFAHTPHGTELLDDALRFSAAGPENWPADYQRHLGAFLCRHGLAEEETRGLALAHVLITATRGALLVARDRESFVADMGRVARTLLPGLA